MASPSGCVRRIGVADGARCRPSGCTVRRRRNDDRADSRGDEGGRAHLPRARRAIPARVSTPTTSTARRINAIVVVNPDALEEADDLDRRFTQSADPSVRCTACRRSSRTTSRPSACRAPTGRSSLKGFVSNRDAFQVQRIKAGGRDRARQVEHGGVRVHAVRDGQLDPAGLHEEPLRARSRHRRIERRHGRRGRRQLRRRRPRQRHRQLHPRPVVSPGARRDPFDDGADEPERRGAAEPARGHRRPDGAHGRGRGRRASGRSSGRTPTIP